MDEGRRTAFSKMAIHKAAIDELVSRTRDRVRRTMILLRAPTTDVFLGRKTHEPSPEENERADRDNEA